MRNIEREKQWDKRIQNIGLWIVSICSGAGVTGLEGGELTGLNIRLPTEGRPETLIVVKAHVGEDKYVAFCGALQLGDALLTWRAKDAGTGLRWREDRPWGG